MTRTIEDLAKRYAEDMCPIGDYCGGVYDDQRHNDIPICIDEAKSVLTWLFNKPLRDRLTEAEKDEIRATYKAASEGYYAESDDINCAVEMLLENIFGKEMFNENEK